MCGIAGFFQNPSEDDVEVIGKRIGETLFRRGPDDFGVWNNNNGLTFVHTRLSIVDLSSAGHQPMVSGSGRYTITYNGEIYNHNKLREKLPDDIQWKSTSDTETLLNCIDVWGIEKTLQEISGMFAFAVFDKKLNTLQLVRDRLGEKPLYYYYNENKNFIFFTSSLNALKLHPHCTSVVSIESLEKYLICGYVPTDSAIYKDTYKVLPGESITFKLTRGINIEKTKYWNVKSVACESSKKNKYTDCNAAVLRLEQLLQDSISKQSIADVNTGAFLSGGVDSSLIVSIYSKLSEDKIKTYTIGFDDEAYNEAPYAKEISNILRTDHTEYYMTTSEVANLVPILPEVVSEPFADSSILPTLLVSQLAAKSVKVCLTGDGGDELFGGYSRYNIIAALEKYIYGVEPMLRNTLISVLKSFPLQKLFNILIRLQYAKAARLSEKVNLLLKIINSTDANSAFINLVGIFGVDESIIRKDRYNDEMLGKLRPFDLTFENIRDRMQFDDQTYYLPGDILTKVDSSGMYYSLESRIPFLDPKIVEFSWQLDHALKVNKKIPKLLLEKYLPSKLVNRKKSGFSVPLKSWIRKNMKNEFRDKLFSSISESYFDLNKIDLLWAQHQSGRFNHENRIWSIYSFVTWHESNFK